ncbi:Uu.00g129000.m01.CDS01 [Anthostomella pinea]|uniref:Uu.00g129000.m01.CDS01 n=1 Tax=Anthostomella pinea TaxID=933095 RepID=A0AAI8YI22_9PEZI|nr:Uu.00g129000.m01.CDS01 [Anthostomella pinea]
MIDFEADLEAYFREMDEADALGRQERDESQRRYQSQRHSTDAFNIIMKDFKPESERENEAVQQIANEGSSASNNTCTSMQQGSISLSSCACVHRSFQHNASSPPEIAHPINQPGEVTYEIPADVNMLLYNPYYPAATGAGLDPSLITSREPAVMQLPSFVFQNPKPLQGPRVVTIQPGMQLYEIEDGQMLKFIPGTPVLTAPHINPIRHDTHY